MATSNSTTSSRTGRSPFRETHGDSPNRHATTAGGGSNKTTPSWFVASDSEQEHFHRPSHKNETGFVDEDHVVDENISNINNCNGNDNGSNNNVLSIKPCTTKPLRSSSHSPTTKHGQQRSSSLSKNVFYSSSKAKSMDASMMFKIPSAADDYDSDHDHDDRKEDGDVMTTKDQSLNTANNNTTSTPVAAATSCGDQTQLIPEVASNFSSENPFDGLLSTPTPMFHAVQEEEFVVVVVEQTVPTTSDHKQSQLLVQAHDGESICPSTATTVVADNTTTNLYIRNPFEAAMLMHQEHLQQQEQEELANMSSGDVMEGLIGEDTMEGDDNDNDYVVPPVPYAIKDQNEGNIQKEGDEEEEESETDPLTETSSSDEDADEPGLEKEKSSPASLNVESTKVEGEQQEQELNNQMKPNSRHDDDDATDPAVAVMTPPRRKSPSLSNVLSSTSVPTSVPTTPKERYLMAVQQTTSNTCINKEEAVTTPMSPKDRYLMAIQQTTATPTADNTNKAITMHISPIASKITEQQQKQQQDLSSSISNASYSTSFDRQSRRSTRSTNEFGLQKKTSNRFAALSPTVASILREAVGVTEEEISLVHASSGMNNVRGRDRRRNDDKYEGFGSPTHSTYQHDESTEGLPVKKQVELGASETSPAKSYLQLDLNGTSSNPSFIDSVTERQPTNSKSPDANDNKNKTSSHNASRNPIETLRASLAMIWRSNRLKPDADAEKAKNQDSYNSAPKKEGISTIASASYDAGCCKAPSTLAFSTDSTMNTLRSSLMTIWKSKPNLAALESEVVDLETQSQHLQKERSQHRSDFRSLPMGAQYLTSSQARQPSYDQNRNMDTLLCRGVGSYDSIEDAQNKMIFDVSKPRMTHIDTRVTDDSFIDTALQPRHVNDGDLSSSHRTVEIKKWQPSEQERSEHDTMVRAILERPSLIENSDLEPQQKKSWDWSQVRKWTLVTFVMLLFTGIIAGCLACGFSGKCLHRQASQLPSEEPEEVKPLVLALPEYTLKSMQSLHSAQAKAYLWLEDDPNRNTYSEQRMLQRYALATLYYSTKLVQNWTASTSWLSYDIHECYWFSSYEGIDICAGDEFKHLVLTNNNLRGNLPKELALLTSLVEIDLSRNVLLGRIPTEIATVSSLERLWLEKNDLNGDIPKELALLTSLTSLSLATNDLKSSVPSELAMLTNMKDMRLFYNLLSGELPSELGLMSNLELLDVDVNKLSGMIPTELGLLSNLKELWLDWNSFVGPIPTQLGYLESLVKLYLGRAFVESSLRDDGWKASGYYSIPSELGLMISLEELYLDNNGLTGLVPTELAGLSKLQTMTLDSNHITDSISPGICSLFSGELESVSIDCSDIICNCGCTCV